MRINVTIQPTNQIYLINLDKISLPSHADESYWLSSIALSYAFIASSDLPNFPRAAPLFIQAF